MLVSSIEAGGDCFRILLLMHILDGALAADACMSAVVHAVHTWGVISTSLNVKCSAELITLLLW